MANNEQSWAIDPENPGFYIYKAPDGTVYESPVEQAVTKQSGKTSVEAPRKAKAAPLDSAPVAPARAASRVPAAEPVAPARNVAAPVAPATPGKLAADEEVKFWDQTPAVAPKTLTPEQQAAYKEFEQLHNGNPNFGQADIADFWQAQGLGSQMASEEYLDAVRKGEKVGALSNFIDETEARKAKADAFGETVDPEQGLFSREYQEAVQYGFPGLIARWGNDWLDTGKAELKKQYPGQTEEWYEEKADLAVRQGQRAIRDYYEAQSEKDPAWRPDKTTFENITSGRWIPAVAAAVAGSVGLESALMPGATAMGRVGGQIGISSAAEFGYEIADKAEGVSDEVSATNIAAAGLLGGAFQGVGEMGAALVKGMRTSTPEQLEASAPSPISEGEFAGLDAKLNGQDPFVAEMRTALEGGADEATVRSIYEKHGKSPENEGLSQEDLGLGEVRGAPSRPPEEPLELDPPVPPSDTVRVRVGDLAKYGVHDAGKTSGVEIDPARQAENDALRASIEEKGLVNEGKPIRLNIDPDRGLAHIADGNHRVSIANDVDPDMMVDIQISRDKSKRPYAAAKPYKGEFDGQPGKAANAPESRAAPRAEEAAPVADKTTAAPAVTKEVARAEVNTLTQRWKNAPEFEIVDTVDEIADPAIRAAAQKDGAIIGFYGRDGKVRLIASNLDNVDQIAPAIFHEGLGHHGMRQKFGDELDNFMTRLHKGSPELRAAVEEWKATTGKDYGDIPLATQVEEVLAQMSEEKVLSRTVMDRIKDWLKNFARNKLDMDLEFSPREIRSILADAHRMVTGGKDTGAKPDGERFIRVLHVSPYDFDKFDSSWRGKGEGAQAYGQGHYFTESDEVADSYRRQFTNRKINWNDQETDIENLAMGLTEDIARANPQFGRDGIGQNVLKFVEEMSWSIVKLRIENNRIPSKTELLGHVGVPEQNRAASAAAQLLTAEMRRNDLQIDYKKPKTYEVDLPDDGKWISRDEPIVSNPELKEMFENDGFTFRSTEDIGKINDALVEAEFDVRYASDRGDAYIIAEEKAQKLRDELRYSIPENMRADDIEPFLADFGLDDFAVSNALKEAGFTGFKYKDGFSRSGKKIEPTHNYVVFDDDVPVISNKYMKRSSEPRKPINLDTIRSTRDLDKAIKDLAEGFEFDPQTHAETMELGERMGLTPARVISRKLVDVEKVPEYLAAVSEVMMRQEARVRDYARRIAEGDDSTPTLQQAAEELAKLGAIVPQSLRVGSAAGRALNAVGMLKRAGRGPQEILDALQNYSNVTLDRDEILKLMARVNELNDPADVAKLATDSFKPKAEDYLFSAWYNMNLLSRLSTQMNNILGTGGHLLGELSSQHIAWVLGLPKILTGNTNRVTTTELIARYAGMGVGVLQGIRNAPRAFQLGMPVSGPSKEAYRPLPMWEAAQAFNTEGKGANLPRMLQNTVNEAAVIAELPGRMMAVTDEFFRSVASMSDYYGRAARDVIGNNDGMDSGSFGERFYSLTRVPSEEMQKSAEMYSDPKNARRNINMQQAHELARRVTFRDELTGFGKGVENALRTREDAGPVMRVAKFAGRTLVPFYRMGERMLASVNRFTPGTGLASRTNVAGLKAGGADRDIALGRQLFGLGLGMLALDQYERGERTGAGPEDYERRMELEESGWKPFSVKLDDGTWFSTNNLDPLNAYMNALVTAAELYDEGLLDEEGASDQMYNAGAAFVRWAGTAAGIENIFRLVSGVEGGAAGEGAGKNAIAGIGTSFVVPGIIQSYNQNFEDTAVRSTRGDGSLGDRFENRVSSAYPSSMANQFGGVGPMGDAGSADLPQRAGPLGTMRERKGGWLGFLFGDRFATVNPDPTVKEVVRLGKDLEGKPVVGLPMRSIELRKNTTWRKPEWAGEPSVKLEEKDFQQYVQLSGHWFKNGLTNEMNTPEYKAMSDEERRALIKEIATEARRAARDYLFIADEEEEVVDDRIADALEESSNAPVYDPSAATADEWEAYAGGN